MINYTDYYNAFAEPIEFHFSPFSNSPFSNFYYEIDTIFANETKRTVCVKWKDGKTTKVKLMEGDTWDIYNAFCIACAKRMYGSNSKLKKLVDEHTDIYKEKKEDKCSRANVEKEK